MDKREMDEMIVEALHSYPVKGLSAMPLNLVSLEAGDGFPNDRKFALALPGTEFDGSRPRPAPKTRFLMLMKHEKLARLRTCFDDAAGMLEINDTQGRELLRASVVTPSGKAAIEAFFFEFLAEFLDAPPRLVQAAGHQFTDVSVTSQEMMHAVSLINLASVRALAEAAGMPLDPMRFRGNIHFTDSDAWSEFSLIGKMIKIGGARLEVVQRTRRCPATDVNPETAGRDINIPGLIQARFGHADMGVYAIVRTGGPIRPGDRIGMLQ